MDLPGVKQRSPGVYTYELKSLPRNRPYEFRARVKHPLLTIFGEERTFRSN